MTKRLSDIVEIAGFSFIAYGLFRLVGIPWTLLAVGVLFVIAANFGKVADSVTTQHPSTE
jgi:TM2 domain-containing membrane protein YozV